MKIALQFRAFLEEHNFLAIPGLGRFEVITDVKNDGSSNAYCRKLLTFMQGTTPTSDLRHFIEYICTRFRIESHVVLSDLEYFSSSTRELLMQGLEAEIPGIGFLNLGHQNSFIFSIRSRYYTTKQKVKKVRTTALGTSFWF